MPFSRTLSCVTVNFQLALPNLCSALWRRPYCGRTAIQIRRVRKRILGATMTLEFRGLVNTNVDSPCRFRPRTGRDLPVKFTREATPVARTSVILTGDQASPDRRRAWMSTISAGNISLIALAATSCLITTSANRWLILFEYKDSGKKDANGSILAKREEVINIANIQSRL